MVAVDSFGLGSMVDFDVAFGLGGTPGNSADWSGSSGSGGLDGSRWGNADSGGVLVAAEPVGVAVCEPLAAIDDDKDEDEAYFEGDDEVDDDEDELDDFDEFDDDEDDGPADEEEEDEDEEL